MAKNKDTAAKAAPKAAPKPAPKPQQEKKNGITRPKNGTQTGRVWDAADKISAATKKPAERAAVMEACKGMNTATIATQYGRWRKFNGMTKENTPKAPAAPAAPAK